MNKLLSILLAGAALIAAGCSTTRTITTDAGGNSVTNTVNRLDPQRTANAIRAIVPPAVKLAVTQQPEARKWIVDARLAICAVSAGGKLSPEDLKAAVAATGIREIQTPEVQAAIETVHGIYAAYYADVVAGKLNESEWLVPVLSAICDALGEGLAQPAPVMPE